MILDTKTKPHVPHVGRTRVYPLYAFVRHVVTTTTIIIIPITSTDKNTTFVEILAKSSRAQASGFGCDDDGVGVTAVGVVLALVAALALNGAVILMMSFPVFVFTDILHAHALSWSKACPHSSMTNIPKGWHTA